MLLFEVSSAFLARHYEQNLNFALQPPALEILTIACLTFCLLLTDRPILGLPEYKLEVVNICKMDETGGVEAVVLCKLLTNFNDM